MGIGEGRGGDGRGNGGAEEDAQGGSRGAHDCDVDLDLGPDVYGDGVVELVG